MSVGTEQPRSIRKGSRGGRISTKAIALIAILVLAAVGVGAWYALSPRREVVLVDGSSTVFPITSGWAIEFNNPQRQVLVAFSGTGGGFQKWCRGETDLSDASRPIKSSEIAECDAHGITNITELLIAYDGLSIVVNKNNDWVESLTAKELCRIWTRNTSAGACGGAGPRVTRWVELNATWPDRNIVLYGPGSDSGTFDYFWETVLIPPKETEHTDQYQASEDDFALVQGVASSLDALGYFGYAYVVPNLAVLKTVGVDDENPLNGDGPVWPSEATIRGETGPKYAPLSRPLFVYANGASLSRQIVEDYLRFGLSSRGMELVATTGYVALNQAELNAQLAKLD